MACDCPNRCTSCGDRLIHQYNRGLRESSSSLGQFIHDNYPHDFWAGDIDQYQMRRTDKTIRLLELKRPGGGLRPGQRVLMPMLAAGIDFAGPRHGYPNTGVFQVEWEPSYGEIGRVTQIFPDGSSHTVEVSGRDFRDLVTGRPFDLRLVRAA